MNINKQAKSVLAVLVVLVFGLIYLAARGGQSQPERLQVALIPMGTTDQFWKAVHAGGLKAARECNVDLIWKGPMRRDDRNAQFEVVESMIARGVAGIVLAPLDDMALRSPVEDAFRRDIPVVIIDSGLRSQRIASFIATNNYRGGVMAGEHLSELLNGRGKVALLRGVEGSSSTDNRERGFLDAMKKYPGIEVVSSNQHGGGTTESCYQASENVLAPFKTAGGLKLDGIFCPNESTTFGMLRALQDGGLAGKVKFVGFDSGANLNRGLAAGEIDALILQNPVLMGYQGVKTAVDAIQGRAVEPQVEVPAVVVTGANMDLPAQKVLLNPDLSILQE